MKRLVLVVCGLAVLVVVVVSLLLARDTQKWTTDSAEAAEHLEGAIEAEQKFYIADARRHLAAALEADPDLLVAKVLLLEMGGTKDKQRWKELVEDLETADLDGLTEREQFLVQYHLAHIGGDGEELQRLLDEYGEAIPDDPFVVAARAGAAWARNDWETAEPLYRRLLEIEPNWVFAYNQLGYMEMARGRFQASEEMFMRYRFIAPDQANPHDSLGELYFLLGRHEEARREFDAALAARPDFCPSYEHLLTVAMVECDWAEVDRILQRVKSEDACPQYAISMFTCVSGLWRAIEQEAWEDGWSVLQEQCGEVESMSISEIVPAFMVAFESGRGEAADAIRARAEKLSERAWSSRMMEDIVRGSAEFIVAYELARDGDLDGAATKLREADDRMSYQGCQLGRFKMMVRLALARVLELSGKSEKANRLVAQVGNVNPRMAERYREAEGWLGLE